MNAPFSPIADNIAIIDQDGVNDFARIDAYVTEHKHGTAFHRPAWVRAVAAACGHQWYYVISEDTNGQLNGLIPLHGIHSALFGRALVSSGFGVDGGILCSSNHVAAKLAKKAWQFAERNSFPTVELRGGPAPAADWIVKDGVYAGFSMELLETEEAQLLAVPRKQRAEIRKGLKNNLEIRTGTSILDRELHYTVYSQSVRNLGTPVFPKKLFDEVLNAFGKNADILTVLCDGAPVASVLSLYHKDTVLPYWGGGTRDARLLRANDVMYFSLMSHARERGFRRFDFGRSKMGTGAYNFKKNWGFEPRPLCYSIRTAGGEEPRDINAMSPKYRLQVALWQRLPLALANFLGPHIAKGLG